RAVKVQLIDANNVYRKLRKNLGNKSSEFSPEEIAHMAQAYLGKWDHNPTDSESKVKIFNNADFGYYKVNIERPKRLKAQFSKEALDALRFDKGLHIPMQAFYDTYGDLVYAGLETHAEEINKRAEQEDWDLNKKQISKLLKPATW